MPTQVILACPDLAETLAFFRAQLGFQLDAIFPADDPREAELSGHGVHVVLRRSDDATPDRSVLRLPVEAGIAPCTAPNGTRILGPATPPAVTYTPERVVARLEDAAWHTGRAGMRYRDLIPGRQGGAIIGSHIRVLDDGPVPDDVHHHAVDFQMIYCVRGRARLVYQNQGGPFDLLPGDCVLQPPGIRHRVLEAHDGLEVVELSAPAEHPTFLDHDLTLPTETLAPDRRFGGQRFVHHVAVGAAWTPSTMPGVERCELGIAHATDGGADAYVLRGEGALQLPPDRPTFLFVLDGQCDAREGPLTTGDALMQPGGLRAPGPLDGTVLVVHPLLDTSDG